METVNIHEAKTHLSRLLEQVAAGDEVIIAKAGKPVAKLVPLAAHGSARELGALAGHVKESADWWGPDPELEALFYGAAEPSPRRVAERRRRK